MAGLKEWKEMSSRQKKQCAGRLLSGGEGGTPPGADATDGSGRVWQANETGADLFRPVFGICEPGFVSQDL